MAAFSTLYSDRLSEALSSTRTNLFTAVRRKRWTNLGQREFVRLTECLMRRASIPLVDDTPEYDLKAAASDVWFIGTQENVVLQHVSGSTTRTKSGKRFPKRDIPFLDREYPGWRNADPGTPICWYERKEGGQWFLGTYPAVDIAGSDTWSLLVPIVVRAVDMVADADQPFTYSGNVASWLDPWDEAIVKYAASKGEEARKRYDVATLRLNEFNALVADFLMKQRHTNDDNQLAFAHDYLAGTRKRTQFAGDPMVDW